MTDESETNFSEEVSDQLVDYFGEEHVYENVYMAETRRYADFIVETPFFRLAIEVENNWEAAIKGIGQAQLYAAHYNDAIPVVIVPEGHIESPEYEYLRNQVLILEF